MFNNDIQDFYRQVQLFIDIIESYRGFFLNIKDTQIYDGQNLSKKK